MSFRPPQEPLWSRQLVELAILFVMAVLTLRGFFLEGYLITTGSMAPGLLGLHQQIACPDCKYQFAFGASFDESVADGDRAALSAQRFATCPNCGQQHINTGEVPLNHGDQLLVHKGVFQVRHPKRWEAIVFRNPDQPSEAYVKRAIGLPGESIRVAGGDLFVNGVIATKSMEMQRDMRIEVADIQHRALSDDWAFPWKLGPGWENKNGRLLFESRSAQKTTSAVNDDLDHGTLRLNFHRRSGGQHVSEVAFDPETISLDELEAEWNQCLVAMQNQPIWWLTRLEFDRERLVLRLRGVMPFAMQEVLVASSGRDDFRRAIFRLAALSHQAPITDQYGYNGVVGSPENAVQDLMLESVIRAMELPDELVFQVPVGSRSFTFRFLPLEMTALLLDEQTGHTLRKAELTTGQTTSMLAEDGLHLEISNFDHQIRISVDGVEVFAPVDIPVDLDTVIQQDERIKQSLDLVRTANGPVDHRAGEWQARSTTLAARRQRLWQFQVSGGRISVEQLKLYRDVYYTPGRRRNAVDAACVVPAGSYFVMGDNSPVSSDSRNWDRPFVPDRLLIGKPFIVHLPSRPGSVESGGSRLSIRLPDFQRIKLIP